MIASAISEAQRQTTRAELAGVMLLNKGGGLGKVGQALEGVPRLLQRRKLHLNGQEKAGGGAGWGRGRKKAKARRVRDLTEGFMADVEW